MDPAATWVVVNAKEYGFYRVNYDAELWTRIIDQLNSDHEVSTSPVYTYC